MNYRGIVMVMLGIAVLAVIIGWIVTGRAPTDAGREAVTAIAMGLLGYALGKAE
jgi:hypothetical protein